MDLCVSVLRCPVVCCTLHIGGTVLKFSYKLIWSMISKEETNSHPHWRSLTGARGGLCVGQAQLHGGRRKAGSQSTRVGNLILPVTTCLSGKKITQYPRLTIFLIWEMGLAVPTFQGYEVLSFSKENLRLRPLLLLKRGRTTVSGSKCLNVMT